VNLENTCHSCTFLAGIQRPDTKRHWIPASAGMTLSGVFAGSMKIVTHSIWGRAKYIKSKEVQ